MKFKYKKLPIILFVLFISPSLFSQSGSARVTSSENVPSETIIGFEKTYPETTVKKWWLIENYYQAEFEKDERIYKIAINESGEIIEERKQLFYPKELPQKVINGFKKTEYKYWKVEEVYVTENTGEDLFYEIKVVKDGRFQIIYFKPNGDIEEKSLSTF